MKKIILLLSLTLLSAFTGLAQKGSTVYYVCGTKQDINIYNLMNDTYNGVNVSADSFTFTAGNQNFAAKKVPGTDFYAYETNDEAHQNDYYIYPVDDNSFFVIPYVTVAQADWLELRYYHTDRKLAAEQDVNKRCAWETFKKDRAILTSYLSQKTAAANNVYAARSKIVYTDFAKTYPAQKNDPAFTKEILAWWQRSGNDAGFPILRITILSPSWAFVRNEYGTVTHKMMSAMYVWKSKKDNQCWARWQSFKYEALGGGTFDTELKAYSTYHYPMQYDFIDLPEGRRMQTGDMYEVDCASFPAVPLR